MSGSYTESKCLDVGVGKGYSTLSLNITRFSELNELPMPIDLIRMDEGNGVEVTLRKNEAKWHKPCHSKFNITKLKRAEKRKYSIEGSDLDTTPRKYTHISSFLMADKTDICFFVRLCHHQNCSMKCQPFTWTVVFGNLHLFCKMNDCFWRYDCSGGQIPSKVLGYSIQAGTPICQGTSNSKFLLIM